MMSRSDRSGVSLIDAIAQVAPWCAPIPTAYLVGQASASHLDWPTPIAVAAAIAIESLGLAVIHTTLELREHNRTRRKSDPPAPVALAASLVGVYTSVAITLTILLDTIPGVVRYAPAIFPLLSLVGMTTLALRADHRRRLTDIAEGKEVARKQRREKAEERERKRSAGTCSVCGGESGEENLIEGRCSDCVRSMGGKSHGLPLALSLQVLDRDGWTCFYCGKNLREVPAGHRHIDHFTPRANGGEDNLENLVTSCSGCNLSKGGRQPTEEEQGRFSKWLVAKAAGPDLKAQILELASDSEGGPAVKQKEIARILWTSPGWVSTVIKKSKELPERGGDN